MKKYFETRKEAVQACEERRKEHPHIGVHKMPKGTRKAGYYAVCSYMEWLNTY